MELKQIQMRIRVRPQRIAVLVDEHINQKQLLSLIALLSRIWGGRYSSIIVVSQKDDGKNAKRCLSSIKPEVVLGVGIDGKKWEETTREICQPRSFRTINLQEQQVKEFMQRNFEGLIWADTIIWAEIKESPQMKRENLRLLEIRDDFPWSLCMAATFGLVPENRVAEYAEDLNAKVQEFDNGAEIPGFLRTCSEMSKKWSWLDFTSYRLERDQIHTDATTFVPSIIVVDEAEPIWDIALFWNLRMQFGPGSSGTIVLFPKKEIQASSSVDSLAKWINSSPINSNYCEFITKACKTKLLESLARRIRPRLKRLNSKIIHVDVKELVQELPLVIPYDQQELKRFIVSDKAAIIEDVAPVYKNYLSSSAAWICDLVEDSETRRVPYDLCLPPKESASQVLNSPDPPRFRLGLNAFGIGIDSINVRFTMNDQSILFRVPRPEELLEELLIESGVKPLKDEKSIRYNQSIDIFQGLSEAAKFLSGTSLQIINSLKSGTLTFGQIKAQAKLGKKQTKKDSAFISWSRRLPEHSKRTAKRRYAEYSKQNFGPHASESEIIEKLLELGVLRRRWKLDKCPYCDKEYWVAELKISEPMFCPGCHKKIYLRDKFQLGYELNELVALSIREGIVPVVLTARFLRNLTDSGFFWLPGIKCSWKSLKTDLDIIACCDGRLVAAECKTLSNTNIKSKTWMEIASQIEQKVGLLKNCGIQVLVISAMCEEFPKGFEKRILGVIGNDMSILLLNRVELLDGERRVPYNHQTRRMRLNDIMQLQSLPKRIKRKKRGKRFVSF